MALLQFAARRGGALRQRSYPVSADVFWRYGNFLLRQGDQALAYSLFLQRRNQLKQTEWKILRSDGTVHQFPFFPGRNSVRWEGLEASAGLHGSC